MGMIFYSHAIFSHIVLKTRAISIIYIYMYICLIVCFCFLGSQHSINFASCTCEPLPVTLARAQLWPATPHRPRLVFTFGLLDWAEALMLEAQVSLNDFCCSLAFRCRFKLLKVKCTGFCYNLFQ